MLELHYPMIQFLIINNIPRERVGYELAVIISYPTRASESTNFYFKNAHKISRILPDDFTNLQTQPIVSLFLFLSRRVQLPYLESMV